MENKICKKVASMLSLYIENKLDDEDRFFVENHFLNCINCYQKYLEMKKIMNNLHLEYQKLLDEFDKLESNQNFSIREYETFYNNISPYVDDELNYEESIKFRKYILKSKPARVELANAYKLKNNIKRSVAKLKDNANINFSKKILKKLKEEKRDTFDIIYQRAAIILGFTLSTIIIIGIYMSFSYIQEAFAENNNKQVIQTIEFPNDEDWVEFTYDRNNKPLLTQK
ncbi:MAG: zf-HC2 domain-containing protein [Candidatus Gastranaerophilales bacterium]|nr:zf-HC2 domain-containing protein [Candidatus Gastranaerophilales bacterium]